MTQPSSTSLLLVDTNAEVIFDTSSDLTEYGYRVLVARSVDQAIAIGRQETFELLLCCEPLDVADGATLLRFLRRNKRLRQLRLVVKQPCQAVGVCLKVIHNEPVYCLGGTASIESMHCILNQTLAMKTSPQIHPVESRTPYLPFNHRQPTGHARVSVS